ncbi:MAG TPA: glycosyltransferase family 4 protein [Pirellulales bacterium]|nr:glycosyltransferase family 4 protein [Pirellulales bacterium]
MRRPDKLLIVAHSPLRGGAEYCLDTTLRNLDRNNFDATVVFPFEGPMSHAAREYGYDVRATPLCHWLYFDKDAWYWKNLLGRSWANVLRLRRLIREVRADVVYTNTSAIFEAAVAARLAGVPHVWHVHEVLAEGNRMQQLLPLPVMKRLIYRLSDRIVFESHSARRVFETSTPADKSVVVYNSLRLTDEIANCKLQIANCKSDENAAANPKSKIQNPKSDCPHLASPEGRGIFGLEADDRVIGFVGQFIDRKNPLLLLRALAKVREVPRLKCLFAGEGPLEGAMRAAIGRLCLGDICRIVGFQSDVAPVMRAIDILVLSSRQESFGLVLVEAASQGKPAIACQCQGPGEIIVDGETGLLVPQDDENAMARAIERMFADDGVRRRMGDAGRRRAYEEFCPVKNTRKLEQVFIEVIEASRRGRRERRSPLAPREESLRSPLAPQAESLRSPLAPQADGAGGWASQPVSSERISASTRDSSH